MSRSNGTSSPATRITPLASSKETQRFRDPLCGLKYMESLFAFEHHRPHILTQISRVARSGAGVLTSERSEWPQRARLFACVNFYEIRSVNPAEECLELRFRIYLIWIPRLLGNARVSAETARETFEKHVDRARQARSSGERPEGYVSLLDEEIEEFTEHIMIPNLTFTGNLQCDPVGTPSIRVYDYLNGMVLWNAAYTVSAGHTFDLHKFPYDRHSIPFQICQNDSRSWNMFDLTICAVQFQKSALTMAEWSVYRPVLKKSDHRHSSVVIRLKRQGGYYSQNVIGVMSSLSLLGFTVFALGADALADRLNMLLTLILTAVAFKFAVGDSMPKVGYNTLMDTFFLANMGMLFVMCILCTIEELFRELIDPLLEGTWVNLNRLMFGFSLLCFAVVNLVWLCHTRKHATLDGKWRRYKMGEAEFYCSVFAKPCFIPLTAMSRK